MFYRYYILPNEKQKYSSFLCLDIKVSLLSNSQVLVRMLHDKDSPRRLTTFYLIFNNSAASLNLKSFYNIHRLLNAEADAVANSTLLSLSLPFLCVG